MEEGMENQEKIEEERGNEIIIASSTSQPQSSSMDQESEEAELLRKIINNHLVSRIILKNIKSTLNMKIQGIKYYRE